MSMHDGQEPWSILLKNAIQMDIVETLDPGLMYCTQNPWTGLAIRVQLVFPVVAELALESSPVQSKTQVQSPGFPECHTNLPSWNG